MEQKHLRSSLMGFTLGLPKKLVPNRMTHHEIYIQDTPESILKTSKDMVSMESLWIMIQTKSETVTWTWFKVTNWWFQFILKNIWTSLCDIFNTHLLWHPVRVLLQAGVSRAYIYIYPYISQLYHQFCSLNHCIWFSFSQRKNGMSSRGRNPLETRLHGAVGA